MKKFPHGTRILFMCLILHTQRASKYTIIANRAAEQAENCISKAKSLESAKTSILIHANTCRHCTASRYPCSHSSLCIELFTLFGAPLCFTLIRKHIDTCAQRIYVCVSVCAEEHVIVVVVKRPNGVYGYTPYRRIC